jgi:hypothetical protein
MATTTSPTANTPAKLAVGVISEVVIPGGSNLIKGDLQQGAVHLILGIAAGMAFGPWGLIAVKLNSLAKAHTGQGLIDQVTG